MYFASRRQLREGGERVDVEWESREEPGELVTQPCYISVQLDDGVRRKSSRAILPPVNTYH